jgi:hypothetical protein
MSLDSVKGQCIARIRGTRPDPSAVVKLGHTRVGEHAEQVVAQKELQRKSVIAAGVQGYRKTQLELSGSPPAPAEAYFTPFGTAIVYTQLGLTDLASRSLDEAYARRDVQLT